MSFDRRSLRWPVATWSRIILNFVLTLSGYSKTVSFIITKKMHVRTGGRSLSQRPQCFITHYIPWSNQKVWQSQNAKWMWTTKYDKDSGFPCRIWDSLSRGIIVGISRTVVKLSKASAYIFILTQIMTICKWNPNFWPCCVERMSLTLVSFICQFYIILVTNLI
jgi:hypothetical protein